jgi:hypothetical protein
MQEWDIEKKALLRYNKREKTTYTMTQPQDQSGAQSSSGNSGTVPPTVRTGEEVYNMIMGKIEPELVLDQIPLLDEKYKNETEPEKKTRLTRYQKAYAEYEKQYEAYKAEEEVKLHAFSKGLFGGVENRIKEDEEEDLENITNAIANIQD